MSSQSLNAGLEILSDSAFVSPQSENTPLWPVIGVVKAVGVGAVTASFFTAPDGGAHSLELSSVGDSYGVGDQVIIVFRGTNPESGIVAGRVGDSLFVKQDGSTPLTGDWDIGSGRIIKAGTIQARSVDLYLIGPTGDGITINSTGQVGVGIYPSYPLDIYSTTRIGDATVANGEILAVQGTANVAFSIDSSASQTGFYHKTSGAGGNNYYIFSDSAGYHFFDNTAFKELFGFDLAANAYFNYTTYSGGGSGATGMDSFFGGKVGIGINSGATAKLDINSDIFRLRTNKTPASAAAAGNKGDYCWDSSYLYICIATNTWRRVAHATW